MGVIVFDPVFCKVQLQFMNEIRIHEEKPRHSGVRGMYERARNIGASLSIESIYARHPGTRHVTVNPPSGIR